jgi:peptidyl-prolyl cis-trans isomerase SurA
MRRIRKCILFLLLCSSPALYSQGPRNQIIDEVIAVVGNTPVLRSELDILISQLDPEVTVTDEIKCELLQKLLIDKMLIHQAEIDSLPISDDEVNDRIDNNIRFFERQMNSRANVEKYLGMSIAEYKKQIFPKVRAQMLLDRMQQKIQSDIKITPKEVREYYEKIPEDSLPFISSEVEVAQIVIKPTYSVEAKEIAKEQIDLLRERIAVNGESFARLAGIYSDDPGSKTQGGLLPEFGRGDMVPEFERAAFKLKKDSISEVIETKFGYHVLKLIDKRGDKVLVRHILIRPKLIDTDMDLAKAKMDTVLMQLRSGKISFCNAVKQYSEDEETKPNCGFFTDPNLGTQRIPFDYLDKTMAAELSTLKPGQYSEPSVGYAQDGTPYYRILFLKVETKPHVANLEADWQRVQALALEKKREKELDIWAEKKRKETYIHIGSYYLYCGYFEDWLTYNKK